MFGFGSFGQDPLGNHGNPANYYSETPLASGAQTSKITRGRNLLASGNQSSRLTRLTGAILAGAGAQTTSLVRSTGAVRLASAAVSVSRVIASSFIILASGAASALRRVTVTVSFAATGAASALLTRGRNLLAIALTGCNTILAISYALLAHSSMAGFLGRQPGFREFGQAAQTSTAYLTAGPRRLALSDVIARTVRQTGVVALRAVTSPARLMVGPKLTALASTATVFLVTIAKGLLSAIGVTTLRKAAIHTAAIITTFVAGLLSRRTGKLELGQGHAQASLERKSTFAFLASSSPVPVMVLRLSRALLASSSTAASMVRNFRAILLASTHPASKLGRVIHHTTVKAITALATAFKRTALQLLAAASSNAKLVHLSGLAFLASGSAAGLLSRVSGLAFTARAQASASIVRAYHMTRLATVFTRTRLVRAIRAIRPVLASSLAKLAKQTKPVTQAQSATATIFPVPQLIKNLIAAVLTSAIFTWLMKLISRPRLQGIDAQPNLSGSTAQASLDASEQQPTLKGRV